MNETFPRGWDWEVDGETVEGRYVAIDEAPTRGYGYCPIVILTVDGEERTVWLFHEALKTKFAQEVERRADGDLIPGELIRITRGGEKVSENGRTYRTYLVRFLEAPKRSAREILSAPGQHPVSDYGAGTAAASDHDAIPY